MLPITHKKIQPSKKEQQNQTFDWSCFCLIKKLPQCILNIIHIPCIIDVINPTTWTYIMDTRALTLNMFELFYNNHRLFVYIPPSYLRNVAADTME